MKIIRVAFLIVLCCVLGADPLCPAEGLDGETSQRLLDVSVENAASLYAVITREGFEDRHVTKRMDAALYGLMLGIEPTEPAFMFLLSTPRDLDLQTVLDGYSLDESMGATFCFDQIYDTNWVYMFNNFAEWADRVCIYGMESGLSIPQAVYTVLVYSGDAPQIVTAFWRIDEDLCITKTSFVYNTSIEPDSIYAAFPIIASEAWGGLDSQVMDLRE